MRVTHVSFRCRYMAIVRPLQHRMSRRRARLALAIIWLASGLLAVPCLLYSTTMTMRYNQPHLYIVHQVNSKFCCIATESDIAADVIKLQAASHVTRIRYEGMLQDKWMC